MAGKRGKKQDPFELVGGLLVLVGIGCFMPGGFLIKLQLGAMGLLLIGVLVGFHVLPGILQKRRFRGLMIDDVDRMDGRTFEHYVACLLESQGYKTTVTPASGDLGVDVIAEKGGVRCAVQCKRWSRQVPRTAVSDAVAGAAHYRCTETMVVTTNYFAPGAMQLAKSNRCGLVDRHILAQWVTQYQATGSGVQTPAGQRQA